MKHYYVPTDPGQLDLRVVDDDRRAVTAYSDRRNAAEAAHGLSARSGRQLSTREVQTLPDWIAWVDNAPHEKEPREDGATDRLHAAALHGWMHERSGTRVSIESAAPPAPWCHPHAIGSVITIENTVNARGQDHMEGAAARRELMTAVEAGGSAWLIVSGHKQLYLRGIEDNEGPWTATSGVERSKLPGAIIGGLMVGPNEAQALREGVLRTDECALRYLAILEAWWQGEGYRVRVERRHSCNECPNRHWATTRLSAELYTRSEAEKKAARERVDTGKDKTEWRTIKVKH